VKHQSQLDLAGYGALIRRRLKLVVAIAIGAAALAFGVSLLQDDTYEATSDLLFTQDEPTPRVDPQEAPPDAAESPERVAATNLALASLDRVATNVRRKLRSPLTVEELRDRVTLEPQGQADIVRITAEGATPREAARLADAVAAEVATIQRENSQRKVQRVIDAIDTQLAGLVPGSPAANQLERRKQQLQVEKGLRTGDVEVAQEAIPPLEPSSPKPLRNGLIGGALGLILAMLAVPVLYRFSRRIETEDEVPDIVGAPVIARVPVERTSGWERELFVEAFQFLRANLQLRDPKRQWRVLAVTSPLPGNGKSTVVARLAKALAQSGSEVIMVDCDLRRPNLHKLFGVAPHREGLTTALIGLRDPLELLQATDHPGVRLLPAGPLMPIPSSLVAGTQGMDDVIESLRGAADYVIIDTSPITVGAEASSIAAAVDGTIMVVDIDTVRRDVLAAASEQLRHARASIIGVVLNRAVLHKGMVYRGYYAAADHPQFAPEPGHAEPGPGSELPQRIAENGDPQAQHRSVQRRPWA
jgi:capsular exopolysaccharide synthesis family protein